MDGRGRDCVYYLLRRYCFNGNLSWWEWIGQVIWWSCTLPWDVSRGNNVSSISVSKWSSNSWNVWMHKSYKFSDIHNSTTRGRRTQLLHRLFEISDSHRGGQFLDQCFFKDHSETPTSTSTDYGTENFLFRKDISFKNGRGNSSRLWTAYQLAKTMLH